MSERPGPIRGSESPPLPPLRGAGDADIDGKSLRLERADDGSWQCSSEIADKYLPTDCRERRDD